MALTERVRPLIFQNILHRPEDALQLLQRLFLFLQVEQLDLRMIQGLLVAFNGRVVTGAGAKPYLSVTLQKEEKPLELLQSILRAMQDILKD